LDYLNKIESIRKSKGSVAIALIDPDKKNDLKIEELIKKINKSNFDIIFIGGSMMMDDKYQERIKFIKKNTSLPLILFPGSSRQISANVDCVLFLNLISGRNPQYLIGEHVAAAPIIYSLKLPTIPTSYILIDGGSRSAIEIISDTRALPQENFDLVLAHVIAGELMGNRLTYLECGSNAAKSINVSLIKYIKKYMKTPLVIGGGLKNKSQIDLLVKAGADYIVLGSILEDNLSADELIDITSIIHK